MITTVSDRERAQAATIEALRQEVTAWSMTVEALEAERDALAADASRYRWLTQYMASDDEKYDDALIVCAIRNDFNVLIDAAMKEAKHAI